MLKQFANHDNVGDFLNGPYSKMEEKTIDKWVEMIKTMQDFPNLSYKALSRPQDSTMIDSDRIQVDQLRGIQINLTLIEKAGGQLVEIRMNDEGRSIELALCELSDGESWVIAFHADK